MIYEDLLQVWALKSVDEFYRHSMTADGHLGKCKECTKADVREHRIVNGEAVREYDRLRSQQPERKQKNARRLEVWREADPRRRSCHNAVHRALRNGLLTRLPCAACATTENVVAHHEDYDRPLAIIWLCQLCHTRHHAAKKRVEQLSQTGS